MDFKYNQFIRKKVKKFFFDKQHKSKRKNPTNMKAIQIHLSKSKY